jgi:hypothetical protein
LAENLKPSLTAAAATGEQVARRLLQLRGAKQSTQGENAIEDAPDGFVDGHLALGMELAQWNMKRPLIRTELPQAIERKINTLANAHSGEADEQQGVRFEVVGVA